MMGTIHFTLGDRAGALIMQIAQEKLLYDYDPQKAIEVLTGSLPGLPHQLATQILRGNKVLEVMADHETIEVVDRIDSKHKDYPFIDFTEWYSRKHKWIGDEGRKLYQQFNETARLFSDYNMNSYLEIPLKDVLPIFTSSDKEKSLRMFALKLKEKDSVCEVVNLCSVADRFLREVATLWKVFDFIEHVFPDDVKYCSQGKHMVIGLIQYRIDTIAQGNYEFITEEIEKQDNGIKKHIDAAIEIQKFLKDTIQPVTITDNYSAGWLAPNGDYYGLNGEISNMLHNTLADAIRERIKVLDGVDVLSGGDNNMDGYLMRNGWIKIHGNWILYDGYLQSRYNMPLVPITDEQISQLSLYGKVCHGDKLFFGFQKQFCSGTRLSMMDKPMIAKLFDL